MKTCSRCAEAKPESDFYPHGKYLQSRCKPCCAISAREWRQRNADKHRQNALAWQAKNEEYYRLRSKKNTAAWRKANPERYAVFLQQWAEHGARCATHMQGMRRARKLRAIPRWANQFFIEEIYDLARLRRETTGTMWHVDHVVPLLGKTVCGLHVESNLAVVPAALNQSKSNHYWPNKP